MSKKLLGHCPICNTLIADIKSQYPQGHPYAGEPRQLERFHDGTLRATLVLTNGSLMDITICAACEPVLTDKFVFLWKRVVEGWKLEISDKHRQLLGSKPYSIDQRTQVDKWFVDACKEPPVGVLCIKPWKDIVNA